ncbi:MAG: hypothetical protein WBY44_16095 [Bryobacteraceae bacterium]
MTGLFRRCVDNDEAVRFLQLFFKLRLEPYAGFEKLAIDIDLGKEIGKRRFKAVGNGRRDGSSSDA